MAHPLSMDLRSRLVTAVDGGLSCRAAAIRFGVSGVLAPPCVMLWLWLMWVDGQRQPYDRIGHRHWSASEAVSAD